MQRRKGSNVMWQITLSLHAPIYTRGAPKPCPPSSFSSKWF